MDRRTKIVCTLGPASSDPEIIDRMIGAGMNVARMNFSHGSHDDHAERIQTVREAAKKHDQTVTILQDLQGPKIRVGEMKDGSVMLSEGQQLVITPEPMEIGTSERVHIDYETLAEDADIGGRILLDDGLLELQIVEINGKEIVT